MEVSKLLLSVYIYMNIFRMDSVQKKRKVQSSSGIMNIILSPLMWKWLRVRHN